MKTALDSAAMEGRIAGMVHRHTENVVWSTPEKAFKRSKMLMKRLLVEMERVRDKAYLDGQDFIRNY